jgi:FkbM family methyltransferase
MRTRQSINLTNYNIKNYKIHIKSVFKNILRYCRIYYFLKKHDEFMESLRYLEHLRYLLVTLGINCVIDVGAHYGEFGWDLRRFAGYRGRIASFEPSSEAYEKLARRAAGDSEWRIANYALGIASDEKKINIIRATAANSLLPPSQFGIDRLGTAIDIVGSEKVRVRTLDEMFDWCIDGIPEPRVYLKMDTQGYDLPVLHGARGIISRVLAMQSEVSVQPIYEGVPRMSEAIGYFESLGFRITGLFSIMRADDLSVIEYDCVLRR